jgi:hypothetical protein
MALIYCKLLSNSAGHIPMRLPELNIGFLVFDIKQLP